MGAGVRLAGRVAEDVRLQEQERIGVPIEGGGDLAYLRPLHVRVGPRAQAGVNAEAFGQLLVLVDGHLVTYNFPACVFRQKEGVHLVRMSDLTVVFVSLRDATTLAYQRDSTDQHSTDRTAGTRPPRCGST